MTFFKFWNTFIFLRRLSIFDLIAFSIINSLIVTHSWWFVLLYIPAILFSAFMETVIEEE